MTTQDLTANDWDVAGEERLYRSLRRYWHPVLYAGELGDQPAAGHAPRRADRGRPPRR